jgi:hypothetical protein
LSIAGSGDIVTQNEIESDALELAIIGSGDVNAIVRSKYLESVIMGSGDITVVGETITHDATISGSGDFYCFDLETEISNVKIFGSGNVEVFSSGSLDIEIAGSGSVYYRGDPETVTQEVAGSGKIEKV